MTQHTIDVGLTLLQADLELAVHRKHCNFCRVSLPGVITACHLANRLRQRATVEDAEAVVRWQKSNSPLDI